MTSGTIQRASIRNGAAVAARLAVPLLAIAAVVCVAIAVKGWPGAARLSHAPTEQPTNKQVVDPRPPSAAGQDESIVTLPKSTTAAQVGIEVFAVEPRSLRSVMTCIGRADFNQNHYAQIRPRVEGIVRQIHSDVGAQVKAGDVLAVVDSSTLGDYKGAYLNALVHEEHFRWQYSRYKTLTSEQAVPEKMLHETEHLLEEGKTDTARYKQQLVNLGFTEDQLAKLVEQKDTSTLLPVMAPWDGTIVRRHAVEGEAVERAAPLFAIADLNTMWIDVHCYESDLPKIRIDQRLGFIPDGLPASRFDGKITWISPEVDPQTRLIHARAEVENQGGMLRANMFGKCELLVASTRDSLVVPEIAVQWHDNKPVVFVQTGADRFEVRHVQLGIKDQRVWEVTSGVTRGEKVATQGSFLLKSNLENKAFGLVE